jgi:hypothetical protein
VATVDDSRAPVAIGLISLTAWPTLLDAVFHNLETLTVPPVLSRRRGARATHHLVPLPKRWPGGAFSDLPAGQLQIHLPVGTQDPPHAQDWHGRLRLLLPYDVAESEGGVTFDHTDSIDRAPKILLKAPTGNFAFGTTAAVRRTLYSRYSGGAYPTDHHRGHTRTLDIHNLRLAPSAAAARQAPPRRTYKTAFIIAARQRSDITDAMIDSLDTIPLLAPRPSPPPPTANAAPTAPSPSAHLRLGCSITSMRDFAVPSSARQLMGRSDGSVRQTVDLIWSHDQFPAGLIRPSKVMANAFKAGFQLIAHRALPWPVGSSDRVTTWA